MGLRGFDLGGGGQDNCCCEVKEWRSVRLTEKQWEHIVTARPELGGFRREILEVVERPDEVYEPTPGG